MKSFWTKCFMVFLSVSVCVAAADAQNSAPRNNREMVAPGKAAVDKVALDKVALDQVAVDREARAAAAEFIVAREEAADGRTFDPAFRAMVLGKLASRPLSQLESMQSQSMTGLGMLPKAFGSSQADLVYTPLTPCRIIDTRLAGGPIVPGINRNFVVAGTVGFSSQGGKAGGCGVPFGPATAAVINFVAVSPAGAGDLRVTPFGTAIPLASFINYAAVPGLNIANGLAVTLCDPSVTACGNFDITIQADSSATDLVADVQGYFSLLPDTVASGRSVQGVYVVLGTASAAGQPFWTSVSFPLPMASAPSAADLNFIPAGGASTANCPGTVANPQAAPGNVCVYEGANLNRNLDCLFKPSSGTCTLSDPFGFAISITSAAAGGVMSRGSWAATAP